MKFVKRARRTISKLPTISQDVNKIDTLVSAALYRETLLKLIDGANQRIYIVALYLQDDEAGREVLTHIYEAKQKNPQLDIKIFVDWHRAQRGLIGQKESEGNVSLYKELAQKYEHQVDIFGVPVQTREVLGVLHLKGFIIDDSLLYSGASLNNIYLNYHNKYRCDRYHLIENTQLSQSMIDFIQRYFIGSSAVTNLTQPNRPTTKSLKSPIKQLRRQLSKAKYEFKSESIAPGKVGLTPLIGVGSRHNRLNKTIKNLIASSTQEVVIFTPYFNLPRRLKLEIRKALKRGVKIHFVIGDKTANDFYTPPTEPFKIISALPYLYEVNLRHFAKMNKKFINSGRLQIHLWKNGENSYHLKGLWVDKELMLITGNNLNPRAWQLDLENSILIHDKESLLREQNEREIETILANTTAIKDYRQIEEIKNYPSDVAKFLKRFTRVKLDKIVNRIL